MKKAVLGAGSALVLAGLAWLAWSAARAPRAGDDAPPAAAAPGAAAVDLSSAPAPESAPESAPMTSAAAPELTPAAAEPGRTPAAPSSAALQGTLLERDSGAPIEGGVVLSLRAIPAASGTPEERVAPGPGGLFRTRGSFPKTNLRVKLLEARSGTVLHETKEPFDPEHGTWTLRVELGLLVPLEVERPADVELELGKARVVERGPAGTSEWAWADVRGESQPFVRFRDPPRPSGATAELELEARSRDGRREFTGRAPLPATRGALAPLTVPLVEATAVVGRVLDADGKALEHATAWLLPLDRPASRERKELGEETDEAGAFLFEELEPGPHELVLSAGLFRGEAARIDVRPGWNDLGALSLGLPTDAAIRGELVDPTGASDPAALLVLTGGGRRYVACSSFGFIFGDQDGRSEFAFEHVPPGDYELSPVSLTGGRFEPERARVSPGAVVTFQAQGLARRGWAFRVRDAESGEALEEYVALGRLEDGWIGAHFDSDDTFPFEGRGWVVLAPGHRSLRLPSDQRFERTTRSEGGTTHEVFVVDVALARGWSTPIVCRALDPTAEPGLAQLFAPPLAGARILADGRVVATTDGGGLAVVEGERAPERLEVELAGWRIVSDRDQEGVRTVILAPR